MLISMVKQSTFISVLRYYEGKSIPAQAYTLAPNEPNGGSLHIMIGLILCGLRQGCLYTCSSVNGEYI